MNDHEFLTVIRIYAPLLVRYGFNGKIYCTPGTKLLMEKMLFSQLLYSDEKRHWVYSERSIKQGKHWKKKKLFAKGRVQTSGSCYQCGKDHDQIKKLPAWHGVSGMEWNISYSFAEEWKILNLKSKKILDVNEGRIMISRRTWAITVKLTTKKKIDNRNFQGIINC